MLYEVITLSGGDWRRGAAEAVIGAKIRDELFGAQPALGQLVRIRNNFV